MRAGQLRHRIVVQKPKESRDDFGDKDEFENHVTIWADVRQLPGSEGGSHADVAAAPIECRIRYRSDITSRMRILWRGTAYDIEGAPADEDGRRREMLIRAVSRS